IVNGTGAVITGGVVIIITATRFRDGVWVVLLVMPFLVMGFRKIGRHYADVSRALNEGSVEVISPSDRVARQHSGIVVARRPALVPSEVAHWGSVERNTVVLLVDALDAAAAQAVGYVRSFAGGDFHGIHLPGAGREDGAKANDLGDRWQSFSRSTRPLEVLSGRHGADGVLDYIRALPKPDGSFVTVVIPELFDEPSLVAAVRKRTTFSL